MSLNWNVSKIANHESLFDRQSGQMNTKTYVLIMSTMFLKLGRLTEKNVDEFWRRLNLWQRGFEALMGNDKGDVFFTRDDVVAHIGLSVNVSDESPAAWNRYFKDALYEEVVRKVSRAERAAQMIEQKREEREEGQQ